MLEEERPYHEVANIFPLLQGEEFSSLKDSIAAKGLLVPIWLHPDGSIIDGRNRHRACIETGTPPAFQTWDGNGSLVGFVVSLNQDRRHLTKSQLAAAAVNIKRELANEIEAEKRAEAVKREAQKRAEREAKERAESGQQAMFEPDPPEVSEESEDQTSFTKNGKTGRNAQKEAAAAVGVSHGYLGEAEKLLKEAPDLFEKVRTGEMSLSRAKRELVKRERQESPPLPVNGKYRVFYADPPWSYGNSGVIGETDNYGHVGRHYTSMTIAELCRMGVDIRQMSEANAVLFLWVTSPLLEECFPVIKAWGFKYKTSFVWDKVRHNFGHYNSVRHEMLLVCTKGSCTPDNPQLFDSVQEIERTDKHSEKPQEFRDIIDTLYTHGNRIELFARAQFDGWDTWGNEA